MTDLGSALGFTLALAARAHKPGKSVLWIASDFAALEAGDIYGLGCDLFGLSARELVIVKVARASDALWAMEEALKCRALAAAVARTSERCAARRSHRHAASHARRERRRRLRFSPAPSRLGADELGRDALARCRRAARHPTASAGSGARLFHSPCTKIAVARPATGHSPGTIMSVPSRRYLSVWLRRLPTDRIERRFGLPGDAPLIVVEPVKSALRVSALNDAAARLGLHCGLPLADVRAMHPGIDVRNADAAADRALLEAVADWCDRYTPLVGLDTPDGLLLDISGCAHLFGGEEDLMRDMARRLWRQGLNARLAVADSCRLRLGGGALWRCRDRARKARALPRSMRCRSRRCASTTTIVGALAQSGLKHIARRDHAAARAARRAVRIGFPAPARSGVRAGGGIDHAASAGAVLHGRAAFRRADRARSGCAGHHRETRARIVGRDGAARRGRAAVASGFVPRRRKSLPLRCQSRRAVARSCAHQPALFRALCGERRRSRSRLRL